MTNFYTGGYRLPSQGNCFSHPPSSQAGPTSGHPQRYRRTQSPR